MAHLSLHQRRKMPKCHFSYDHGSSKLCQIKGHPGFRLEGEGEGGNSYEPQKKKKVAKPTRFKNEVGLCHLRASKLS